VALGDVESALLSDDDGVVVSVPEVVVVSVPEVVVVSVPEVVVVSVPVVVVSDGVEVVSDDDVDVSDDDVDVSDDDVDVSDDDVVDDVELVELVPESVDEPADELLADEGAPDAPVPSVVLPEEVRTVDDAGGDPQSEVCAFAAGAWIAKAPNAMSATPRSPSPIAIPSAAGLRSSALTVQPRIT
jgi:hypothetical protein